MSEKICALAFVLVVPVLTAFSMNESNLQRDYPEKIAPWLLENGVTGSFESSGITLRYLKIPAANERAAVVVLGGHAESYIKYAELFYDARRSGLTIYALDQRNQGFSERLLADREKDHVGNYQDYVDDLHIFVRDVVNNDEHSRLFVLGHSMGGAVAAMYLTEYPDEFDGAILSSPVIRMAATPLQGFMLRILNGISGGEGYVPGGGPFAPVAFEDNRETHSRARHERKFQDYDDYPEIRTGHPTVHWYVEMLKMSRAILSTARSITVPVLILQAGTDDYGNTAGHDQFAESVGRTRIVRFPEAFHEILIEKDEVRNRALSEIAGFIDEHAVRIDAN